MALQVLAIHPLFNTPNRKDASGAFIPEARAFVELHAPGSRLAFDNNKALPDRRAEVTRILQRHAGKDLRCVAFFCHGWGRGKGEMGMQTGFMERHIPALAALLDGCLAKDGVVALYACDSGRDEDYDRKDDVKPEATGVGGFASQLSKALKRPVLAHAKEGHTTTNPFVMRFGADGVGVWYSTPGTEDFKAFARDLRIDAKLRYALPFLNVGAGAR
jgi:hypothetical protein